MKSKTKKIFYLGPVGTYTEIAADHLLKFQNAAKMPKNSILQVIESIDNNSGDIGVIPIENSIEGIVRETVDNLFKTTSRVMITQEILVPISHCLISKQDDISKITKIISKPEAIAQCNYFIANNLTSSVEKIAASSTSEAVRQLTELPEDYAAIGTFKAAEIYGMQIIARDINDEKDNLTRFVSLGSKVALPTGNDKTSIALTIHNQAGSLVDILSVFRDNGLNLSYIESRPSKKVFGDYTFFIDFDGHIEDESVQKTIGKIAPLVSFYRFLGSYPKGEIITI